ncbi:hypothetical protein [Polyangium sp. 6x1]|uniref:hypothetical protein n=1 Tax=Polyangium sp. 6x1 TaxID=3042689 RepID=UPI00248291A6|nr:hypothetical protein [Polyangium sp. 6x1]MDI1448792.1 hypothetical protein [Polyangium sp. 6x1]
MSELEGRCGSCAAFTRPREDSRLGRVGDCALEVYPSPIRQTSTCGRYRPKGAAPPPPPPRAAGEPRRARSSAIEPRRRDADVTRPSSSETTQGARGLNAGPSLPREIDIDMDIDEFRRVLREVLSEELGLGRSEMGARWQGGEVVLRPGKAGTAEKRIPLDTFFHKIVMVRDKLRLLEAKLNAHEGLPAADKVQLQAYITACYGSLTTFNVLFAERDDWFVGAAKDGDG